jgi:ketosteroid isomerase-like protein
MKGIAAASFLAIALLTAERAPEPKVDQSVRQVIAADDQRIAALRSGNPEPLRRIYADDYTLVTPTGLVRSKADQLGDLASGRARYSEIRILSRTVRMYADVAIVLSHEHVDAAVRDQQAGGDLLFTRVYKKFGDEWRVIATQGTAVRQ